MIYLSTQKQAGSNPTGVALCLLIGLFMATGSLAAIPTVSNIEVQQSASSQLVEITYDLHDADGDAMFVSAVVSLDGGNTWTDRKSVV